ncbi:MAG: hypothetical protein ABSG67_02325 [Thermoguttaceae bacterium]|jgi:hypothetical protein
MQNEECKMKNAKLTIGSAGAVLEYVAKRQAVLLQIENCKMQIAN